MPVALFWSVWSIVALLASALMAGHLIGWSSRVGAMDVPNDRSSHSRPVPLGGGLAIVAVAMVATVIVCVLHPESSIRIVGAMLPATVVAAVSWIDDVRPVAKRIRFAVHLGSAVATVAVLGPVRQVSLGSLGSLDFGVAAWPLTLLWIVGLTNAFNFMDGIDGIAGLTAAVTASAVAMVAAMFASPAVGGVALASAAAACGFLTCNWQPAKIFMGDVGSAFCGFLLAVLPLALPPTAVSTAVAVTAFVLWPFIFDTGLTIIRRGLERENIFQAHRSHLYQRMVIAGWSHRAVASLYGGLSALAAVCAAIPFAAPPWRHAAEVAAVALVSLGAMCLVVIATATERRPLRTPRTCSTPDSSNASATSSQPVR